VRDNLVLQEWGCCGWISNPSKENKILISKDDKSKKRKILVIKVLWGNKIKSIFNRVTSDVKNDISETTWIFF